MLYMRFFITLTALWTVLVAGKTQADFSPEQYIPTLQTINMGKEQVQNHYKILFTPSVDKAVCLTAYNTQNEKIQTVDYNCSYQTEQRSFSQTRLSNDKEINDISAFFINLKHKSPNRGIAFLNTSLIKNLYADFINNQSEAEFGQSIFHNDGSVVNFGGDFVNNRLNNEKKQINDNAAIFFNSTNSKITQMNSHFIGNKLIDSVSKDDAVLLNLGILSNINGIFAGNKLTLAKNNSGILVNDGNIVSVKGTFSANIVTSDSSLTSAGLFNAGNINLIEADFINNHAYTNTADNGGSAIHTSRKSQTYTIRNAYFINNTSVSEHGNVMGGAIKISGKFGGTIENSSFINNSAVSKHGITVFGGAVYSEKPLIFNVNGNYNSQFSGNFIQKGSTIEYNAVYLNKTSATFIINDEGKYTFDDSVDGKNYYLYFHGNKTGTFSFNNKISNARQIQAQQAVITLNKGEYGKGEITNTDELVLMQSTLKINNGYKDNLNINNLNCTDCIIVFDVNTNEMTADLININDKLTGTVKIDIHADSNNDIRNQQPILFAQSNSFSANRDSFLVNDVYGNSHMFDIIYKEEDGGLKKSWFLSMNDRANPKFSTNKETPNDKNISLSAKKETSLNKDIRPQIPNCQGNIGCLFFKSVAAITNSIRIIIFYTRKISEKMLLAIENALHKLVLQLDKATIYFAPKQDQTEGKGSTENYRSSLSTQSNAAPISPASFSKAASLSSNGVVTII